MIIGGCRSDFWGLTPKTIQIDFEAYQERQKRAAQDRWELGAYVKAALSSSVLACGLADKRTAGKLPKYPERPFTDENTAQSEEMSEERLQQERLKAYCFFKTLGKRKK